MLCLWWWLYSRRFNSTQTCGESNWFVVRTLSDFYARNSFLAPVTSSQLIFVVGGIYGLTAIVYLLSHWTSRDEKQQPNHSAILKIGTALADVLTDIFLILWLHDEHPELENLMYLSMAALILSFCIGLV